MPAPPCGKPRRTKGIFWGGGGHGSVTGYKKSRAPTEKRARRPESVTGRVRSPSLSLLPPYWILQAPGGKRSSSGRPAPKVREWQRSPHPSSASLGCAGDTAGASCVVSQGVLSCFPCAGDEAGRRGGKWQKGLQSSDRQRKLPPQRGRSAAGDLAHRRLKGGGLWRFGRHGGGVSRPSAQLNGSSGGVAVGPPYHSKARSRSGRRSGGPSRTCHGWLSARETRGWGLPSGPTERFHLRALGGVGWASRLCC